MEAAPTKKKLLSGEVARLLGISTVYVRMLARSGALPYEQAGDAYIFDPEDVQALATKRAANPKMRRPAMA